MNELRFEKMKIKAASLNDTSSLPSIENAADPQQKTKTKLDEDDGLFIGYGFIKSCFPYKAQDAYDRELKETELTAAVLENDYLKATFVPSLGGRLWSLYDKIEGKELLFSNPVVRYGNLAVRNAWLSGGVEWNCGVVGHHPNTCEQMFCGTLTTDDGTKVLRMYQYERIRAAVYQMDFFMPENSRLLFCRMRIVNPNEETIPMYWWSNIAVSEQKDARVIMPTEETFTNRNNMISKTSVPISEGLDITYPVNNPTAVDFFWKIPGNQCKFVCHIDKNGYGLIQTSTKRLQGRKLFVWGQGPGGSKWQEFLSEKGKGRYAEIQAGLAYTQYECLPMPPKTAWEWIEAYGPLHTDGAAVHGDWRGSMNAVKKDLSRLISEDALEELLLKTKESIALKPAVMTEYGNGWGALENLRREKHNEVPLPAHLDFGTIGAEQQTWAALLKNGFFDEQAANEIPPSYMLQKEWTALLEEAVSGADRYHWYTHYQLATVYFALDRIGEAKALLEESMRRQASPWALYALALVAKAEGKPEDAAKTAYKAALMNTAFAWDPSLVKQAMKLLLQAELYDLAIRLSEKLPPDIAAMGRVKLLKAFALCHTGRLEEAEALLFENGGIDVPDIKEGENSVTELWYYLEEKKADKRGAFFDRKAAVPPPELDFRMDAKK